MISSDPIVVDRTEPVVTATAATHTNRVDPLVVDGLRVVHRARGRSRHEIRAVDGVSLRVGPSEIVGVVGESGSGKSSVALAACALGRVTAGQIRVAGHDLHRLRGRSLRRARADVQMVFQDPHGSLDPRQTIGHGFAELRAIHPERATRSDEEVLAQVDLTKDVLRRLPHQVSGGQAQRVSIARALLLDPRLLVADEPTSALDVSVQAQVLELLDKTRRTEGLGVLFISHDLAVVRMLCDRAYVMHQGVIVESGEPRQLFDHPQDPYTQRLVAAVPGKNARLLRKPR